MQITLYSIIFFFFVVFSSSQDSEESEWTIRFSVRVTEAKNDFDLCFSINTTALIEEMSGNCTEVKFWMEGSEEENLGETNSIPYYRENECFEEYLTNFWINVDLPMGDSVIVMSYGGEMNEQEDSLSFSGYFISLLDQTEACGSGSTEFSSGQPLYIKNGPALELGNTYPTHSHTFSLTSYAANSEMGYYTGAGGKWHPPSTHTHAFVDNGITSGSNTLKPPGYSLRGCKSNSLTIVPNLILPLIDSDHEILDGDDSSWELFSALDNKFPVIDNTNPSQVYSSDVHTHSLAVSGGPGKAWSGSNNHVGDTDKGWMATATHYHDITPCPSGGASTLPPYEIVHFVKYMGSRLDGAFYGLLTYASDVPPLGWQRVSEHDGVFFQGTSIDTSVGLTGGSDSHTHAYSCQSGQASAQDFNNWSGTGLVSGGDHSHTILGNLQSVSLLPDHNVVVLIQRKDTSDVSIIQHELNEIGNNGGGAGGKFPTGLVVSLAFGALFIICCIIVVVAIGAVFLLGIMRRQRKKLDKLEEFGADVLLAEAEAELGDTPGKFNEGRANMQFNEQLFEIKWSDIKIGRKIGAGGQCSIFQCEWMGKVCAFKMFRIDDFGQEKFTEFERELSVVSSVHHPHILEFYGACLEVPRVGLLMRWAENGDLSDFLKKMKTKKIKYPMKERMRIVHEIASALLHLHNLSIIHRDLKSENVVVCANEEAKVMDFGFSRMADIGNQKTMTKRVGTSCSFQVRNAHGLEVKIASNPDFRPKLSRLSHTPRCIREIAVRCWSHRPDERYTMLEIVGIVEKWLRSQGKTSFPKVPPPPRKSPPGPRRKSGVNQSSVEKMLRAKVAELEEKLKRSENRVKFLEAQLRKKKSK